MHSIFDIAHILNFTFQSPSIFCLNTHTLIQSPPLLLFLPKFPHIFFTESANFLPHFFQPSSFLPTITFIYLPSPLFFLPCHSPSFLSSIFILTNHLLFYQPAPSFLPTISSTFTSHLLSFRYHHLYFHLPSPVFYLPFPSILPATSFIFTYHLLHFYLPSSSF